MKFALHSLLLLLCAGMAACGHSEKTIYADYRIVPKPANTLLCNDNDFELNDKTRIFYAPEDEAMRFNARFLAEYIAEITGFTPETAAYGQDIANGNVILLRAAEPGHADESYRIKVSARQIDIEGGSDAGVFYAVQTLRKAAGAVRAAKVRFPAVEISDAPRFRYRGVMLDVARTFYPVEEVKRIIDLAALHNLNVFHWHLTDDQGWRIQIDAYPELTRTGAFRSDTTLTGKPATFGGFYTKDEIRDMVDYAARRYIQVIPEIDMPGHMTAALASYPELGCTGGPYTITSQPGVRRDILCAGNPRSFEFAEKVLEEVIELFPAEYIHIGGDESPRNRWRQCPKCQALIRREGLRNDMRHSAEDKLQGYFNTHIETFLAQHGRRPIGWDEIVDGGLSPNATVMSWRGTEGGIRASKLGYNVIMSPNSSLYLDYYQTSNIDEGSASIGGYVPLKKVYDTPPVPEELAPEEARRILGVQANVWSTYMRESATMEEMLLPRLAALSEIAWSNSAKNFNHFMGRLDRLIPFYERDSFRFFPYLYDVKGEFVADHSRKSVGMTLASLPEADIYFTLDGSKPSEHAMRYTDTVWISTTASIRAIAIMPDGRQSEPFREQVAFNKATMKPLRLLTRPHPKFAAASLNDGLRGKRVFTHGNWTGWYDADLEAILDLEKREEISQIAFNTLLDFGSHIMDAAGARIEISDDGEHFRQVYTMNYPAAPYGAVKRICRHEADFSPALKARYIKLHIQRSEHLPEAFFDRNLQPYLFVDEIYVY